MLVTVPSPTPDEVARIGSLADPVLRNLQITQCYQELSDALRALLPGNANWCTFAASASKQAGQTIRHEDLVDLIVERLRHSSSSHAAGLALFDDLFGQLRRVLAELGPVKRSASEVASGNLKVFAEIGLLFARFLEMSPRDEAKLEAFCAAMEPGDPPGGQDLLKRAFRGYHAALLLPAGKEKAERMLLSNLLIGMHEQLRLQPQIKGALDGSLITAEDIATLLAARLASKRGLWARILDWFQPSRLDVLRALTRPLANEVKDIARVVITDHLMTLTLPPNRILRLGRDVPAGFPSDLAAIANPELAAVLEKIDPTANTPAGSAAMDWANFDQRIHYIADLFRAFQQDAALFDPPFTPEQVAALKAGALPPGPL